MAKRADEVARANLPGMREMLDRADRVIGYGSGLSNKELICTIIASKSGVKLGIVDGASCVRATDSAPVSANRAAGRDRLAWRRAAPRVNRDRAWAALHFDDRFTRPPTPRRRHELDSRHG